MEKFAARQRKNADTWNRRRSRRRTTVEAGAEPPSDGKLISKTIEPAG